MLKQKQSLTKLNEELEGRRGKLCQCCKGFRHLAYNCRSKKEGKKGATAPQNRFEVLRSRVMQCGVKERMIKRQKVTVVECFKCGEKGHKCGECPEWRKTKEERRVRRVEEVVFVAMPQKAQQKERPACSTREEVQEWQKSLMAVLQQRAQEHCREGICKGISRVVLSKF